MYCRFCGKQILDDSVFCMYCGKNQGASVSASSSPNDDDDLYDLDEFFSEAVSRKKKDDEIEKMFDIRNGVLVKYKDWFGDNENVVIPNGVTIIGEEAFQFCQNLTHVTIPAGVTTIEKRAFTGCKKLKNVVFPEDLSIIEERAFCKCDSLKSISIPRGITRIEEGAFQNCANLTTVSISEGLIHIGHMAFWECSSLSTINLPQSLTTIESCAFSHCVSLTNITLPNNVSQIGDGAFAKTGVISLTIPRSTISIGSSQGMEKLANITVAYGNPVYHSSGNCLIETASKTVIGGCKNSIIPTDGSVTSIGSFAFDGCSGLTSITIPNTVTSISNSAFAECGLTNITIPYSVQRIYEDAFYNCSRLYSIYVPNTTYVERNAFSDCPGRVTRY